MSEWAAWEASATGEWASGELAAGRDWLADELGQLEDIWWCGWVPDLAGATAEAGREVRTVWNEYVMRDRGGPGLETVRPGASNPPSEAIGDGERR